MVFFLDIQSYFSYNQNMYNNITNFNLDLFPWTRIQVTIVTRKYDVK